MKDLIFEKSADGRRAYRLPKCDVPVVGVEENMRRMSHAGLPQVSEVQLVRHYTNLSKKAHGVDNGFYPLGSCTMKYNPKINEDIAALPDFTDIHPLQPENTAEGCNEVIRLCKEYLCEITGMDGMTLQPAAGAQGEFTGLLMIKAYFKSRNELTRNVILIPDSAHGTNPAGAAMAGFNVVSIPSDNEGGVDIAALKGLLTPEVAGIMLTNPNTLGLFDRNITEISRLTRENGRLLYYDGANLNAIMGITRPGDMGFDVVHLNLHKTFATPHGGGGPGSGPVGCKNILKPFLPEEEKSIGRLRAFNGNFLVYLKALTYIITLGHDGLKEASQIAVLNANYLLNKLKEVYETPFPDGCMHEFVLSCEKLKKETGIRAADISKSLIDYGIHPPTMYFPLIVPEALMFEPTETETLETLTEAADIMIKLFEQAHESPDVLHNAPVTTPVGRLDEVRAARSPVLKYNAEK